MKKMSVLFCLVKLTAVGSYVNINKTKHRDVFFRTLILSMPNLLCIIIMRNKLWVLKIHLKQHQSQLDLILFYY